jgi:hypothetical protein
MSDPITFDTVSPRFALPLLFSGQSQKEIYVNEAHAITDALLHCAIEGVAATPPTSPNDGENWLIAAGSSGEWAGKSDSIACRQAGGWIYVAPKDGLTILNRSNGQRTRYFGGWQTSSNVATPIGGTTVDNEARSAINQILSAMRTYGILSAN